MKKGRLDCVLYLHYAIYGYLPILNNHAGQQGISLSLLPISLSFVLFLSLSRFAIYCLPGERR